MLRDLAQAIITRCKPLRDGFKEAKKERVADKFIESQSEASEGDCGPWEKDLGIYSSGFCIGDFPIVTH